MSVYPNYMVAVLDRVTKQYSAPDGAAVRALGGISLNLHQGDWAYVIGSNGSGKSTLLRMLSGDVVPDEGLCWISPELRGQVRYVEQGVQNNLIPSMTLLENMLLTKRNPAQWVPSLRLGNGGTGAQAARNALALFGMGLENRLNVRVSHLSGGQQQAVVVARVLASGAKLLLLDEFTSALDLRVSQQVLQVVRTYAEQNGVTVVSVTHDLHQVEKMGGRIIVLEGGRLKAYIESKERKVTAREIAEIVYG